LAENQVLINMLLTRLSFFLLKKKQRNQACTEIAPESARGGPKIHLATRFARFKMNFYGWVGKILGISLRAD
jgi:hypothetical protein